MRQRGRLARQLTATQRKAADEWLDSFQTAKAIAEKYGTHESTLRYWVKKALKEREKEGI